MVEGPWEIKDYKVVAVVQNATYEFELRMVWTPPRYGVGVLKHGGMFKSVDHLKSMEAPDAFDFALQKVVEWHRILYPDLDKLHPELKE